VRKLGGGGCPQNRWACLCREQGQRYLQPHTTTPESDGHGVAGAQSSPRPHHCSVLQPHSQTNGQISRLAACVCRLKAWVLRPEFRACLSSATMYHRGRARKPLRPMHGSTAGASPLRREPLDQDLLGAANRQAS